MKIDYNAIIEAMNKIIMKLDELEMHVKTADNHLEQLVQNGWSGTTGESYRNGFKGLCKKLVERVEYFKSSSELPRKMALEAIEAEKARAAEFEKFYSEYK